ncbi:MAG TPA: tRNA (adenosine(37)-N6)-threonylcarbamoyltransferase complex dimerization subunit type 1 TsaB [Caldilineae bacterium]|jgi:tRNA threonylcarbamoyladenosine biosynthesis protein TsaB|nr:tRNA (adenosine(37)-N6)-threonylcarbamoyltransferase complex dimerization subunit type 1 TsaB [Caldilineae bacterium]
MRREIADAEQRQFLLALDTATNLASIALYDGWRVIAEHSWHSDRRHTVELTPNVYAMLRQAGVQPAQLSGVVVALGPGSFTGLRVALSLAKGMTLAIGAALLGIPTLDIIAYPYQWQSLPVCAVIQAGRGRLCWALYRRDQEGWRTTSGYRLSEIDDLAGEITELTLFSGEILPQNADRLRELLGNRFQLAPPAMRLRRAGILAELGWARYQAGDVDDPTTLSPIYLHEPPPGKVS